MSRLKKALYFIIPTLLLLLVFIYDVVRITVELGGAGYAFVREGAVLASLFFGYLLLEDIARKGIRVVIKQIGRLLIIVVSAVLLVGLVQILPGLGFSETGDAAIPLNSLTVFFSMMISLGVAMASLVGLLTIKELVYHKRKKGTKRNFVLYLVLVLAASALALPPFGSELTWFATMTMILAIIMMVVNSFRQNWIVFLSRREKVYCIIYSALLFMAFLAVSLLLTNRTFLNKAMLFFSGPVERFVILNSMYGAVYFGMAFITTLFHLPTAEVYERKQSELSSLHNLGRLVTQVFDFRDLVNTVTHMTREVCGARSAWLELLHVESKESEQRIEVVSRNNISEEEIASVMTHPDFSLREFMIESKKVLLIDDVASDRRTKHVKTLGLPIASLLSVPLLSHQSMIGVLHATKDIVFGFDQDDIDVLSAFADHVTIAIENSRLIEQSLERERLRQELMVAQDMQRRLLPQRFPENKRMDVAAVSEPSFEVGGDYFDFVTLDENRVGVVIGDVSGKGVSAAFYMAEVKGIFQSLSKMVKSPRELLIRANETLMESLERKAFISLLYAIYDTSRSTVTLARAGHCPMILISARGYELIRPNGLGLGLTEGDLFQASTEERTLTLQRGDVCILYTDGITEARNSTGEEFGYDRLVELAGAIHHLSALEIQNRILSEIRAYCGKVGFEDDLTLVVVKWQGNKSEG
ncbi:MAG: GAF domain-containing SpoIIE family protein phosphatase [Bacteroidota bacterium]